MTSATASTPATHSAFTHLFAGVQEAYLLNSTASILGWDQETMMPNGGAELRSRQLSQLARLGHESFTSPKIGELIAAAQDVVHSMPADCADAVNVREISRDYHKATKLPSSLIAELAQTASQAQHAWVEARRESNFKKFQPWLEKTVQLNIQKAQCLGWPKGGEAWDALADYYEPALTAADVTRVFEPLRARLQKLLDRIRGASKQPSNAFNELALPIEAQEKFVRHMAKSIGFDFSCGRLDRSAHPFCGGSHCRDVRMTTRYAPTCVFDALGSTMHESGHGMYEQGLDFAQAGLPMGTAAGLSVHESQSRMWENQVGRSMPFWKWARPQLGAFFEDACDHLTLEHLYQAANVVEPGFIRVESDEATYNMHVMIRFQLERDMLNGNMPIAELPAVWNKMYKDYLGVSVPDDRRGCLQDVHWSMGAIGYFPTYTLGTLLAAQLFERARKDIPGLEDGFTRGEFAPLLSWLRANVHCHGRRYRLDELCRKITGAPLSADPMMRHLEAKLLPLYGLE